MTAMRTNDQYRASLDYTIQLVVIEYQIRVTVRTPYPPRHAPKDLVFFGLSHKGLVVKGADYFHINFMSKLIEMIPVHLLLLETTPSRYHISSVMIEEDLNSPIMKIGKKRLGSVIRCIE